MTESTDKQLPDEQQLDEYLKGDSSVSRQYRQLHTAEVPTELDRLVLRQAEDAVKTGATRGRPAWVRWTAPLAVAASAVLVLSIVIETGVRDETTVLQAPQQTTMQAKKREREESRELAESKAKETVVNAQAAKPQAADTQAADTQAARTQAAKPQAERAPGFVPPAEVAADLAADEAPPALAEPANDAPQAFTESRPPPPPVAAPAPSPRIMPARSMSRAANEAERALQAASVEEAAQKAMDPEAWLKAIRELRKENKQEQADREWQRFRAAFPDYEVAETDAAREAQN
jgi:hypothetical protein